MVRKNGSLPERLAAPALSISSGVSSALIGASRPEQAKGNVASLDIALSAEQQTRLDASGVPPQFNLSFIFDLPHERIFGALPIIRGVELIRAKVRSGKGPNRP